MATGFVILLIVAGALALAAWPITVLLARRRYRIDRERAVAPREERPHDQAGYPHGTVVGGLHVGGGRSVAPRRDEEVTPLADEGLIPGQGSAADTGADGAARRG